MYNDPIVDEVRKIREQQAEEYGYDLDKIIEQAAIRQKESNHPTVSFARKPKAPAEK
ncbi:MAG TPA: hypothetical protein PLY04_17700 [bacterium]|nr:hypothetical protein [bacterium]